MANSYTKLYIHVVFSVRYRKRLIHEKIRARVEKYICGIVRNLNHKVYSIYCMPDHIHLLIRMKPYQSISDLVRDIKSNSTSWLNANRLTYERFYWQSGFGAFAIGEEDIGTVIKYIENQAEHHKLKNFKDEYRDLLIEHNVEFKEEYLFDDKEGRSGGRLSGN